MKAIFLCDKPKNIKSVYSEEIRRELEHTIALDSSVFTKADLLATPDDFSGVEYLFSTWGMPALSEEEITRCLPSLKCVFYAAGSVQAFARPFLTCGVRVFSAWAANAVPVAEYTVAQIILANKGFFRQTRLMASGCLSEANALKGACLGNYNQRVGIIGCGMIGSMVAERLRDYELEVLTYDPFLSDERAAALGVRRASLDELFASCAVVSNHLANNAATRGILQYGHFSSLPHGATFINTGRGAQVVEDDLVRALAERPDVTALLDVTYPEPPMEGHPFYSLPNCFLTPHIAGSLGHEVVRMARYMLDEFKCCLDGSPCRYEVDLEMLERMA